jgi:hypothetical protein
MIGPASRRSSFRYQPKYRYGSANTVAHEIVQMLLRCMSSLLVSGLSRDCWCGRPLTASIVPD